MSRERINSGTKTADSQRRRDKAHAECHGKADDQQDEKDGNESPLVMPPCACRIARPTDPSTWKFLRWCRSRVVHYSITHGRPFRITPVYSPASYVFFAAVQPLDNPPGLVLRTHGRRMGCQVAHGGRQHVHRGRRAAQLLMLTECRSSVWMVWSHGLRGAKVCRASPTGGPDHRRPKGNRRRAARPH